MKLNTLTIVVFSAGIILLYAGIKDKNPKDVIMAGISGKSPADAPSAGSVQPTVMLHPAAPKDRQNSGTVNV